MQFKFLIHGLLVSLPLLSISCGGKSKKKTAPQETVPVNPRSTADESTAPKVNTPYLSDEDKAGIEKWAKGMTARCSAADALPSLAAHADEPDATGAAKTRFVVASAFRKKLGDTDIYLKDGAFVQLSLPQDPIDGDREQVLESSGPLGSLVVTTRLFGSSCLLQIRSVDNAPGGLDFSYSINLAKRIQLTASFKPRAEVRVETDAVKTSQAPAANIDTTGLQTEYAQVEGTGNILWLNATWQGLLAPKLEPQRDLLASFLEIPAQDVDAFVAASTAPAELRPMLIAIEGAKDPLPMADDFAVILPKGNSNTLKVKFYLPQNPGIVIGGRSVPSFLVQTELRDLSITATNNVNASQVKATAVGMSAEVIPANAEERLKAAKSCVNSQLAVARFFETYRAPDRSGIKRSNYPGSFRKILQPCQAFEPQLLDMIAKEDELLRSVLLYPLNRTKLDELPGEFADWVGEIASLFNKSYRPGQGYNPILSNLPFGNSSAARLQALSGDLNPTIRADLETLFARFALWQDPSMPDWYDTGCARLPWSREGTSMSSSMMDLLIKMSRDFGELRETFHPVISSLKVVSVQQGTNVVPAVFLPMLCLPLNISDRANAIGSHPTLKTRIQVLRDQIQRLEVREFSQIWQDKQNPRALIGELLYKTVNPGETGLSIASPLEDFIPLIDAQSELLKRTITQTDIHRVELKDSIMLPFIIDRFQQTSILEKWVDADYADAVTLAEQAALISKDSFLKRCEEKGLFFQMDCQKASYSDFNLFSKATYLQPRYKNLTVDVVRMKEKFGIPGRRVVSEVAGFTDRYLQGLWTDCTEAEFEAKHAAIRAQLDEVDEIFQNAYRVLGRSCR